MSDGYVFSSRSGRHVGDGVVYWLGWRAATEMSARRQYKTADIDDQASFDVFKPEGAQASIDSRWFKVGVHGKVFARDGLEWVLSQKPKHVVVAAIDAGKGMVKRGRKAKSGERLQ